MLLRYWIVLKCTDFITNKSTGISKLNGYNFYESKNIGSKGDLNFFLFLILEFNEISY